jgi:hypothetical protein
LRNLMDVTPISATGLVRGTHGLLPALAEDTPLVISSEPELLPAGSLPATSFKQLVLDHLFETQPGASATRATQRTA